MASVALGQHFKDFVRRQVEAGRFNNASEVVRAGLRLLEDSEAERAMKFKKLDDAVARGIADADAGRIVPADRVFDRLEEKYRAMSGKAR